MTLGHKAWDNLKAKYLKQVEKALSSVKHPHMAEILEDVQLHMEQRFCELQADSRTNENLKKIIHDMGSAAEYAELLAPDTIVVHNKKTPRKYAIYLSIAAFFTIITILLAIVIHLTNNSLPKTEWKNIGLLDYATRSSLGSYEKYYEEKFHKETNYEKASQKKKNAMIEQWIKDADGLNNEKSLQAISALGYVKTDSSVALLTKIATAKGGSNRIKWVAVRGLAKIANPVSTPTLISLLDHYNKNILTYAKVGLTEITGLFFGDSKEQWENWQAKQGHKYLTISRAYWFCSDKRPSSIPSNAVPKNDEGHMLVHVDERFANISSVDQYKPFFNQADKRFTLKANGHPDIQANSERGFWGQEFYIRIPKSEYTKMQPAVAYTINPMNENLKYQWKVADGVNIYKPD